MIRANLEKKTISVQNHAARCSMKDGSVAIDTVNLDS